MARVEQLASAVWASLRTAGLRDTMRRVRCRLTLRDEAARYRRWVERHTPSRLELARLAEEASRLPWKPLVSIVTPVCDTPAAWLRACVESVRHQVYPHWELCLADDHSSSDATRQVLRDCEGDPRIRVSWLRRRSNVSAASNAALATATGEFVAFLDHDDELAPEALVEVARHLNRHPDADIIYSDEDKLDRSGVRCDPFFKPDWSPDHFLACMYTSHLMVVRRALLAELGGFRTGYEGAQDYDLVLRLLDRVPRIDHLPRVLYHWRKSPGSAAERADAKPWAHEAARRALEDHMHRQGVEADVLPGSVPGFFRVRRHVRGQPLVSIIIPTRGKPHAGHGRTDLLDTSLQSLQRTTYSRYEVLVVSETAEVSDRTRRALEHLPHRLLTGPGDGVFNFSKTINHAVAHAQGEHLLLFNDDLEVQDPAWLTAMLEQSQESEIGAVGARLVYPDGRLQHVGILIGVCGVAAHAFHQHPRSTAGYAGSAIGIRNCSAVTGACLMTRREAFDRVGGFNERLAVDFNDVDYCLRLREAGYRVVFTPHAELVHHESASFGWRTQSIAEAREMRRIWGDRLTVDPYYNVNLSTDSPDYRVRLS